MSKRNRLLNQFKSINDPDLKEIIASVVAIEQQYRSSSKDNFPRQKVRDAVDAVARKIEISKDKLQLQDK